MSIMERRTRQGWTQEQLAQHSGLSVRTIQRIERGNAATLESLKCLAAVFETDVSTLMQEQTVTASDTPETIIFDQAELEAIEYVQNLKGLYVHAILFAVIIPCLFVLNLVISPNDLWILYVIIAWLAGLGIHAVAMFGMFSVFGADWEQRQFQKRMNQHRR